ncbi:MAG: hypothetical protein JSU73_04840 [candidate division WOR-3 bacterium]|nr:MAG: hypothetical protein JSU73_04840 [candidate division WOR-3 bacterium]
MGQQQDGARYLIVAADSLVGVLQPLAEWKTLKGMQARIVPLSVTGSEPEDVLGYVRNAWNTWPVPPEYLLLACSPSDLTGYEQDNDSYYGNMTGDYLMEIPVGRFPAENTSECSTMVVRTLRYERYPGTDTAWYLKGTTISNEDGSSQNPYYQPDSRFARELWLDAGYTHAESLCNWHGHTYEHAVAALNDGRAFLTYRGVAAGFWNPPFSGFRPDFTDWTNYAQTPVVVSATCLTVTLAYGEEMLGDMSLRCGTPESLCGAVAFFGTTRGYMHVSHIRSSAYRGFFSALFSENVQRIGPATLRARFWVDSIHHSQNHYEEWALLGDPELNVWTGKPRHAEVGCDSMVLIGPRDFEVRVSVSGQPVSGVLVCVSKDSAVYEVDTTDTAGRAVLSIDPTHPGVMNVVASGMNLRPHEGTCRVGVVGAPFVSYLRHSVNDSPPGGNGDGSAGPGEKVTLPMWVLNYGDSVARGVVGRIASSDTLVSVTDSVASFGTIPGRDSALAAIGFRMEVLSGCPDGHTTRFCLTCRDTTGAEWVSEFDLLVGAPDLEFRSFAVNDSNGNCNGRLDPFESVMLTVFLRNNGHCKAANTRVVLRSGHPRLIVTDSIGLIGMIEMLGYGSNAEDPFGVTTGLILPETEVSCTLHVTATGYSRTIPFTITVGRIDQFAPIPDGPRTPPDYWAYDDVDSVYPEHPEYDWVELRGVGTRLELGDNQTVQVPLPSGFGPFVYYGEPYGMISVCSNGWAAPGSTSYAGWSNRRLPSVTLSPPILAVNWDDLYPAFGGGVLYHYDPGRHLFVVEWDSVHYRTPVDRFETFELVLHDSTMAADDGNSEFVYQYRTANWYRSSSVGMQDRTGTIGLTSLFDGEYHAAAAPIRSGRAIKFTTDVPVPGIGESDLGAGPVRRRSPQWLTPNPVRSVLFVSEQQTMPGHPRCWVLLDATGRRVMDLEPGENDIRHVAPGVYFVAPSPRSSPARGEEAAVRKIVIQK